MKNRQSSNLHGDYPAAVDDNALSDRKELAATAFQRTRMPMVVTDATQCDHPIVLANKAFLTLTGYASHEVLGRNCRFLQGEETSPTAVAEIRAALKGDREVSVEILNYRKDGSTFWCQVHLSPIHDEEGHLIYYFGSQIDRTAYRKIQSLQASEHRLLMEVDHRANNVLALVDSIVRLSQADDAARYATSVQTRVQALAKAHMLLSRRGWHEIPMWETISSQIELYATRATMKGPEVMLLPHAVQPLALVIHELCINAASHGSLSGDKGCIEITWKAIPENKGLAVTWKELGGPPPLNSRRAGFGTVITDATICRQFEGCVERKWSDQGIEVSIEIPNVTAH